MPNGQASRERLIRRAYFDLLGLPPTPADVEAFVNDPSPNAYEKLIDRLLENEHVGERWGRHWLDLVRFAESDGYIIRRLSTQRLSLSRFRHQGIQSGHAVQSVCPLANCRRPAAAQGPTGRGRDRVLGGRAPCPTRSTSSKTRELIRYNQLDDMISTLGTSMLGITFGCARCHAHKYDPIPQEDYYRLIACFSHTDPQDITIDPQSREAIARPRRNSTRSTTPW